MIQTVTVIGATGTMGSKVAGIFASFGGAKVYCVGRDKAKIERILPKIVGSVRADCIRPNLVAADYAMLDSCVAESDLVFESVSERIDLKSETVAKICGAIRSDAYLCTGTSGLSITSLAECCPEDRRGRFFGVHFFNPPYSMSLCELTATRYSDPAAAAGLVDYLEQVLRRTVVKVKDTPAFLANRIGFHFINRCLQLAERWKDNGGIDYIDAIFGPFTGRAMPPLATSDYVGLDVHKAIVDNIYQNTNDYAHNTFLFPGFAAKLVREGNLGRKSGRGLYIVDQSQRLVYDINTQRYREVRPYVFSFVETMKACIAEGDYENALKELMHNQSLEAGICRKLLIDYIVYGLYAAGEVVGTRSAADDVMAEGFNWCPPVAMYCALSSVADVRRFVRDRTKSLPEAAQLQQMFSGTLRSSYDYRRFLRV